MVAILWMWSYNLSTCLIFSWGGWTHHIEHHTTRPHHINRPHHTLNTTPHITPLSFTGHSTVQFLYYINRNYSSYRPDSLNISSLAHTQGYFTASWYYIYILIIGPKWIKILLIKQLLFNSDIYYNEDI